MRRPALTRALGALLALGASAAHAQVPGAGSSGPGPSHGWALVPSPTSPSTSYIVHLPPRTEGPESAPASAGAAARATTLRTPPEAFAAREARLYMAFPPEPGEGNTRQRRVLTLAAEPGPVSTVWVTDSAGRRFDALPSLPGDGTLLGLACSPAGPVALLRTGDGDRRLLGFSDGRWSALELPPEAGALQSLFSAPDGFGIVARLSGNPQVLRAHLDKSFEAIKWTPESLRFTLTDGAPAPPPDDLQLIAGHYVYTSSSGDGVSLWSPAPAATYLVARLQGVSPPFAAVPLDDVGRLALVWTDPPPRRADSEALASTEITRIAEVSVLDGAVIYQGAARLGGPISSQELKLLAVALVGIMGLILIFVLRPESPAKAVNLPPGVALAEPGRRAAAGLIDALIAGLAGAAITGVPLSALVVGYGQDRDQTAGTLLLAILAVGIAHGTFGEWLFGRTLGKLLAGCGVARPRTLKVPDGENIPALSRPTLARALLRNLIKWLIPPLAILGMNGPDFRHRGDLAAGTIVFRPLPPEVPKT